MRTIARLCLAAAASAALLLPAAAEAKVHITVDLDAQTIHVEAKDKVFDWKVSSGKAGYDTPAGKFNVLWMDKDHHSDEYEQAPMPDSIFFAPGYAIHGFTKSAWGHKASHGCVRLPAAKAAVLFDLVKAEGADITITGASPVTAATIQAKRELDKAAAARETASLSRDGAEAEQAGGYVDRAYADRAYADGGYPDRGYADRAYGDAGYDAPQRDAGRSRGLFGSFY